MVKQHPSHCTYHVETLLLSIVVAYFGSYMTTCLSEQLRAAYLHHKNKGWAVKLFWILMTGTSLGGIAIWGMHFMCMASVQLKNDITGEDFMIDFNVSITIMNLLIMCLTASVGVGISCQDIMFAKSKAEILEMFLSDSKSLTMGQVRKMKDWMIVRTMTTKSLGRLIAGGVVISTGICIMHYVGLMCMEYEGYIEWHGGIIAASILIALIGGTTAFWILFRVLSIFPGKEWIRQAGAIVMTIAVLGTKYTGMAAATFYFDGHEKPQVLRSPLLHQEKLAQPLYFSISIVIWVYMVIVFADLRNIAGRYRKMLIKNHQFEQMNFSQNSSPSSDGEGDNSRVINSNVNKARYEMMSSSTSTIIHKPSISISNSKAYSSAENSISISVPRPSATHPATHPMPVSTATTLKSFFPSKAATSKRIVPTAVEDIVVAAPPTTSSSPPSDDIPLHHTTINSVKIDTIATTVPIGVSVVEGTVMEGEVERYVDLERMFVMNEAELFSSVV